MSAAKLDLEMGVLKMLIIFRITFLFYGRARDRLEFNEYFWMFLVKLYNGYIIEMGYFYKVYAIFR